MARSDAGYVVLHRKMFTSDVTADPIRATLFMLLVVWANWEDSKLGGEVIKRGELVTGIDELSRALNVHRATVARKLISLEKSGVLARRKRHKGSHITILNYNKYQDLSQSQETASATDERLLCDSHATDLRPSNTINSIKATKTINAGGTRARAESPSVADLMKEVATLWTTRAVWTIRKFHSDEVAAKRSLGPDIWQLLEQLYPDNTWANFCVSYKQQIARGAEPFFRLDLEKQFKAFLSVARSSATIDIDELPA